MPICNKELKHFWNICILHEKESGQSKNNKKYLWVLIAISMFFIVIQYVDMPVIDMPAIKYPSTNIDPYSYSIVYSSNGYIEIVSNEALIVKTDVSGGYRLLFDYNISSSIKVMCMDSANYDLYKKGEDYNFYTLPDQFANNKTYFQAPYSDTWHIIFYNNRNETVKAKIMIMRKNSADTYKSN